MCCCPTRVNSGQEGTEGRDVLYLKGLDSLEKTSESRLDTVHMRAYRHFFNFLQRLDAS